MFHCCMWGFSRGRAVARPRQVSYLLDDVEVDAMPEEEASGEFGDVRREVCRSGAVGFAGGEDGLVLHNFLLG